MKTHISLYVLALITIFAQGCQTDLDINLPAEKNQTVVNGLISSLEQMEVYVTKSLPISGSSDDIEVIKDATVQLLENDEPIALLEFSPARNSYVLSDISPIEGKSYRLKVFADDSLPVELSTTVPTSVAIESVEAQHEIEESSEYSIDYKTTFNIRFTDPADAKNYYLVQALANDNLAYIGSREVSSFVFFHGVSYRFTGVSITDLGFNGKSISLQCYFTWTQMKWTDEPVKLQVRLVSLSEELYKYLYSYNLYKKSLDEPYSEPVVIFSAALNGIGILGGYSYTTFNL